MGPINLSLTDSVNERLDGDEDDKPVRILLFSFMFMFQAYAALVGDPQHSLKTRMGIHGSSSHEAHLFQEATNMFQVGKTVARVAQIILLVRTSPRGMVVFSHILVFVAVLLPGVFIFGVGMTDIELVFAAYLLGGVGLGIFESSFLSVTAFLGKNTKLWTIMGAPLGFGMLNIVLGTALGFEMPVCVFYYYAAFCLPVGLTIFIWCVPVRPGEAAGKGCAVFRSSLSAWKDWFPPLIPWLIAKFIGNFALENTFPLTYNVYNRDEVPFLGPASSTNNLVRKDLYLSLYFFVMMALGDTISRRVPIYIKVTRLRSMLLLLLAATGMCFGGEMLLVLINPIITGVGTFIALFGQGFIYGMSTKFIDGCLPKEHAYAAYMFWCFAGDLGGVLATSTVVNYMAEAVCKGRNYTYVCAA